MMDSALCVHGDGVYLFGFKEIPRHGCEVYWFREMIFSLLTIYVDVQLNKVTVRTK